MLGPVGRGRGPSVKERQPAYGIGRAVGRRNVTAFPSLSSLFMNDQPWLAIAFPQSASLANRTLSLYSRPLGIATSPD